MQFGPTVLNRAILLLLFCSVPAPVVANAADPNLLALRARAQFDRLLEDSRSASAGRRLHAVELLQLWPATLVEQRLVKLLEDSDERVRLRAAELLMEDVGRKHAQAMLSSLDLTKPPDHSAIVAARIASLRLRLGDRQALKDCLRWAELNQDHGRWKTVHVCPMHPEIRVPQDVRDADAGSQKRCPICRMELLPAEGSTIVPERRDAQLVALSALAEEQPDEAVPLLKTLLAEAADPAHRLSAAALWSRINRDGLPHLRVFLSASGDIRRQALEILSREFPVPFAADFERLLTDRQTPQRERLAAARGLAAVEHPAALKEVRSFLDSRGILPPDTLNLAVSDAIAILADYGEFHDLQRLNQFVDSPYRHLAAAALLHIDHRIQSNRKQTVDHLLQQAGEGGLEDRVAAIRSLGSCGLPQVSPMLVRILQESEAPSGLRIAALNASVRISVESGHDRPLETILAIFEEEKAIRLNAVELLAIRVGSLPPESLELLRRAAASRSAAVRLASAVGLGSLQVDNEHLAYLEKLGQDDDPRVRLAAARSMWRGNGELGAVVAICARLLAKAGVGEGANDPVSREVLELISDVGREAPAATGHALVRLFASEDAAVRQASLELVQELAAGGDRVRAGLKRAGLPEALEQLFQDPNAAIQRSAHETYLSL